MTLPLRRALALALLLFAASAHADAYDAAMAQGAAAKEHALDVNDAEAWDETLARFLEADAIRATKESKYEVAYAAARLKEDDLAVDAYERALSLGLTGQAQTKAQDFVDANADKMARLEVKGPAGATIVIARRRRGALPLDRALVVFPGVVHVRVVSSAGVEERDVETKAGEKATLDVTPPIAPAPSASAPPAPTTIAAVAPKPIVVEPPPIVSSSSSRPLGWTLVAVGGGLAIVSGVTYVVAAATISGRRDALSQSCDHPDGDVCVSTAPFKVSDAQDDADALATWKPIRTVSAIGFGVGIATAIVGAITLSSDDGETRKTGWIPSFSPSLGGGVFALSGAF